MSNPEPKPTTCGRCYHPSLHDRVFEHDNGRSFGFCQFGDEYYRCQCNAYRPIRSQRKQTAAELGGEAIEFVDHPRSDGVYVLRQRVGETGVSIFYCVHVYSSYMPTLEGAREWVAGDKRRQETGEVGLMD